MKKHLAYFFLCLTLISSVNVLVDMHLCEGEVKSVALFKKAKKCFGYFEALEFAKTNATKQEDALNAKSCCGNAQIEVKAQQLKNEPPSDFGAIQFLAQAPVKVVLHYVTEPLEEGASIHRHFKDKIPKTHLWKQWENFRF